MSEVIVFTHDNRTIVKTCFPKASNLAALKTTLAQTGLAYSQLPAGSILSLVVFDEQDFDQTTINLFEAVAKSNAKLVRATAFLGVSGAQKALFKAMISITGRRADLFDSESEALTYLVNADASSDTEEDPLAGL